MKRGGRLPAFSKKRRAAIATRADVRAEVLERDDYRCQVHPAITAVECGGWGEFGPLEVHEIIPRDAWAAGYLVVANCITACPNGHRWITDHPDEAHALGLHGYSHERTDVVTIRRIA